MKNYWGTIWTDNWCEFTLKEMDNLPCEARKEILLYVATLKLQRTVTVGGKKFCMVHGRPKLMHHCVGSYIDEVRSGECYIYRVMEPGRATLEIRRDASGAWVQGQLKAHCNGRPGMDVARQVQKWLYGDGAIQRDV